MRPILLSGAYGRAGAAVARDLARLHMQGPLLLGGRRRDRLEALAGEIEGARPVPLDLSAPADVSQHLSRCDLWINCAPWPAGVGPELARVAVASEVVYVDIHPDPNKPGWFAAAFRAAPSSEARACLEAGISPGGPALVANALCEGLDAIDDVTLEVAMRDHEIPDAGLLDILAHARVPAQLWEAGAWRKARLGELGARHVAPGFVGPAAPTRMLELDELARRRRPKRLRCDYLAPSKRAAAVLAVGQATGLVKGRRGRSWLLPALRRAFAAAGPPDGIIVAGRAAGWRAGQPDTRRLRLSYDDVYEATAAPVTAAARLLLDGHRPPEPVACFGNQLPPDRMLLALGDAVTHA